MRQFGQRYYTIKKITPSVRFVYIERDEIVGVGIVADDFVQVDVFVIHKDMKINDFDASVIPSFVKALNDCVDRVQSYTPISIGN